jgi:hypothetical protein
MMPKRETITDRVIYQGLSRIDGESHPYLHYSQKAGERILTGAVQVRDPAQLKQLEMEFAPGDETEIATCTDWDDPELPTTLLSFAKTIART